MLLKAGRDRHPSPWLTPVCSKTTGKRAHALGPTTDTNVTTTTQTQKWFGSCVAQRENVPDIRSQNSAHQCTLITLGGKGGLKLMTLGPQ